MSRSRLHRVGFTLIELLVVISIIALLIGILLPALGAARKSARQLDSSTKVRSIHQSLANFSMSNKNFFPGITSRGEYDTSTPTGSGATTGGHPAWRYLALLTADFMSGDGLISPEDDTKTPWSTTGTNISSANFSYAMLKFGNGGDNALEPNAGRKDEWRLTSNSQAIVITDRNIGVDETTSSTTGARSVHSEPGEWKGSVAYNDGHVKFEQSHFLVTQYAGGNQNAAADDNLFLGNDGLVANSAPSQHNAAMVFHDQNTFSGQN